MRVAALDVGSNTVKLLVARRSPSGHIEAEHEDARVTRLSEGVTEKHRRLAPAARERTMEGLAQLLRVARGAGVLEVGAVATAGLRAVEDADEFLAQVRSELGLSISVIDGLREGQLAFRGAVGTAGGPAVVVDVGGRSTEVVGGTDGSPTAQVTLDLGGLSLTQRHLTSDPPTERELFELRVEIRQALQQLPPLRPEAPMWGVSGTFLSLAGLKLGVPRMVDVLEAAEGQHLSLGDVHQAFQKLRKVPTSERMYGDVIPPGRADIIVAATAVILEILMWTGRSQLAVTRRGLRYGLAAEMFDALQRSRTGA